MNHKDQKYISLIRDAIGHREGIRIINVCDNMNKNLIGNDEAR